MSSKLYTTSLAFLIGVIISHEHFSLLTQAIAFDEVSSLHIWITVSSLANKDPSNSKSLLFRQIELNWINAPLDDNDDFIGLYLDTEPNEMHSALPVSVHKLNGRMHGKTTTDYYLPMINFMNETKHLTRPAAASSSSFNNNNKQVPTAMRPHLDLDTQYDLDSGLGELGTTATTATGANFDDKWHRYNSYGVGVGGVGGGAARQPRPSLSEPRQRKSMAPAAAANLLQDECVGYCVAYHSQNRILASNCLKTSPNWMHDAQVSSRSLPSLMIPGTHNSATYPRHLDKTNLQIINKYQINQDESVFNQLVYGIRYLDLRVGCSKVKQRPGEEFWIYHDIFRTDVSLDEVLEQVGRFLELTSNEIIIMDFHRFTVGFQNENIQVQRERHAKLVDLLFKHLGQHIIPSYLGQHAPLNEYIAMGKRLLIGYASRAQLLGPQADQHSSMFGLYSAQAAAAGVAGAAAGASSQKSHINQPPQQRPPRQQVGDIVSIDASSTSTSTNGNTLQSDQSIEQQTGDTTIDRRMGTRIYNKLKSLKLISRSFSKRSADKKDGGANSNNNNSDSGHEDGDDYDQTGAAVEVDVNDDDDDDSDHKRARGHLKHYNSNKMLDQPKRNTGTQFETRSSSPSSSSAPLILLQQADDEQQQQQHNLSIEEEALSAMPARLAILFPPIRHLWPNKDTVEGLAQFMNETTCRKYFGELRSMMVELTPTVFGAISDKYDGNRRLADQVNRPVTDWIRQRWLHCLNIVASDFYLGNDLIRLSIYANKMRSPQHGKSVDLNLPHNNRASCKSFRRLEHLLDKSKIITPPYHHHHHHHHHHHQQQHTYSSQEHPHQHLSSPSYLNAGSPQIATTTATSSYQAHHPDAISDLFSYFKRLFNL